MVRKLASVLLSLAVISPAVVQALGLGEIKLNSYLNQPLDARIEILSSKRGETDGMQVKLASPEAFERAGLEFTNNLRQLRFTITPRSNGKQYIQVTTRKGYREPYLNFLLEVNWSSGRILREYSELVDPPSLVKATPPVTQAPRAVPVQRTQPVTSQPRTSQRPTAAPRSSSAPSQVSRRGQIGDTYRTRRNDTAWKIATQFRPDSSVTVEQTMMAILRTNPDAFIKQNINRLKAGYTLTIPDRDSMLSQSHAAAVSEMREQTRQWRDRKTVSSAPEGRLEILSPKPEKATTGDQAPGTTAAGSAAGSVAELQRQIMLVQEASEAQKQENAELRLRISQLEEQIKNAQKLTELKADQLAALQKNLGEMEKLDTVPATEPMQEASQEAAEMPAEAVEEQPSAEATTAEQPQPEKKVSLANVVEARPAPADSPVNQHVVEGFKRVDISQLPASELPAQPFKTMMADTTAEQPASDDFIARSKMYFEQNPIVKWIALGALILLLMIIVIMFARRRRHDDYEESILQEPIVKDRDSALQQAAASSAVATAAVAAPEPEPEQEEELDVVATDKSEATDTSFLSDMILSDMSDMQGEGGQADPLTEADVFLAYGRFGPAENLIKGAIEKEPERNDLRLKLLEIYYSAKNKNAFLEESKALHEILAVQPDPATWEKVVEMGADLCPEDALFTYQPDAPAPADAKTAGSSEDDTEVMDFDLSEFENQIDDMASDNEALDLDLDALAETDSEDLEKTVEIPVDSEEGERLSQSADADITREMTDDDITRELNIPDFDNVESLGEDTDSTLLIDDELDMEDDSLDDIDEIGTKLDLARAYIDMGDPEGARSILEEVIEEGSEEQQTEARDLMKKV